MAAPLLDAGRITRSSPSTSVAVARPASKAPVIRTRANRPAPAPRDETRPDDVDTADRFRPGTHERSLNDAHADGVECDARQVHENLTVLGGLEHIHGRGALAAVVEGIVVEKAIARPDAAYCRGVAVIRGGARHSARIVARADRGPVLGTRSGRWCRPACGRVPMLSPEMGDELERIARRSRVGDIVAGGQSRLARHRAIRRCLKRWPGRCGRGAALDGGLSDRVALALAADDPLRRSTPCRHPARACGNRAYRRPLVRLRPRRCAAAGRDLLAQRDRRAHPDRGASCGTAAGLLRRVPAWPGGRNPRACSWLQDATSVFIQTLIGSILETTDAVLVGADAVALAAS